MWLKSLFQWSFWWEWINWSEIVLARSRVLIFGSSNRAGLRQKQKKVSMREEVKCTGKEDHQPACYHDLPPFMCVCGAEMSGLGRWQQKRVLGSAMGLVLGEPSLPEHTHTHTCVHMHTLLPALQFWWRACAICPCLTQGSWFSCWRFARGAKWGCVVVGVQISIILSPAHASLRHLHMSSLGSPMVAGGPERNVTTMVPSCLWPEREFLVPATLFISYCLGLF